MDLTEKTVQKHYVYEGKIISVRCDEALRPDGKPCKRELIEHPGGACVLYVEDGRMLLVKQFRYAYGEVLYEIPAGKLEAGEDPALAAARELSEEAGVEAEKLELLFGRQADGRASRRGRVRSSGVCSAGNSEKNARRWDDQRREDNRRGAGVFSFAAGKIKTRQKTEPKLRFSSVLASLFPRDFAFCVLFSREKEGKRDAM